jgi:hypothetical protein
VLRPLPLAVAAVGLALPASACGSEPRDGAAPAATAPATAAGGPRVSGPTLAAAGDIACAPGTRVSVIACHHPQTADVLERIDPDRIAALGDLQYDRGRLSEFRAAFAPTWGRFMARLRPAPGNHEYATPGADGYFDYFGARAGPARRGYYSYDLGTWHVVSLNSNCSKVSCARGSAQERWLRADLARNPNRCTLAYWHHPRFSSGLHGDDRTVTPLWLALQRAGADVVLAGHDHSYERFAPQTSTGRVSARDGMVQFVVGTGGVNHYPIVRAKRNSRARTSTTFGVLELTLGRGAYAWRFVPEAGRTFEDRGSARCR